SRAAGLRQVYGGRPEHRRDCPAAPRDGGPHPSAGSLGTIGRLGDPAHPAYKGTACFNKTQVGPRQKATKPFRLSGRAVHGDKSSSHERPRDEWIEIPVPAIVSAETFALAAERLADNKRFAPRRTIEPSIVQGLVSCRKCGYALSRTSARTSARKIHYYRCLGSDAWRHLGGAVCDSRPIRQDLLDQIVWQEVIHLIEDPTPIRAEL